MGYASWSVVFGEQPSAAKWNILGTNDASFNDGSGFTDNTISLKKLNSSVAFYAYKSSAANTVNGIAKVNLETEVYDNGSNFDNATNYRFVAPMNGIYHFDGGIRIANAAAVRAIAYIYKNGTLYSSGNSDGASTFAGSVATADVKLASTDYVELYHQSSAVNAFDLTAPSQALNFLCGHLVAGY